MKCLTLAVLAARYRLLGFVPETRYTVVVSPRDPTVTEAEEDANTIGNLAIIGVYCLLTIPSLLSLVTIGVTS